MAVSVSSGLIPAWAGKTACGGRSQRALSAHPRVGGENRRSPRDRFPAWGSSPRGRGKRDARRDADGHARLIPAWAGKTRKRTRPPRRPRGSSPRGRGKRDRAVRAEALAGLIPAWAGKTGTMPGSTRMVRAHPRVGGENDHRVRLREHDHGSSPRGRGKLVRHVQARVPVRLIPAWAGKTTALLAVIVPIPAHPRVGGENY